MGKINRIEVIDWTKPIEEKGGRAYVKWENNPLNIMYDLQDDGRTLKIFLDYSPNPKLKDLANLLEV
jgi:hypothetical protein